MLALQVPVALWQVALARDAGMYAWPLSGFPQSQTYAALLDCVPVRCSAAVLCIAFLISSAC